VPATTKAVTRSLAITLVSFACCPALNAASLHPPYSGPASLRQCYRERPSPSIA
jgi:hypothetical protein